MKKLEIRYATYISGSGNNIKKIISEERYLLSKIKLIISDNPNGDIEKICKNNNIVYVEYKKNIEKSFSDFMLKEFKIHNIDYCFSFGIQILKGDLLKIYKNRIINFHPSLLPHFSGFNAIDRAIESNVKLIGNTAHFIDESIDGGPIILQNVVHIDKFLHNGYWAVIEEQIVLMEKIDMLLTENRIHVENGIVEISGANYEISTIYPEV